MPTHHSRDCVFPETRCIGRSASRVQSKHQVSMVLTAAHPPCNAASLNLCNVAFKDVRLRRVDATVQTAQDNDPAPSSPKPALHHR